MAKTENLTIEILKQIRDATAATSQGLDATNARLDKLTGRVDGLTTSVEQLASQFRGLAETVSQRATLQTEADIRLSTEVVEVGRAVQGVHALLRERLDDRDKIDDHERRIRALERRSA